MALGITFDTADKKKTIDTSVQDQTCSFKCQAVFILECVVLRGRSRQNFKADRGEELMLLGRGYSRVIG